MSNQIDDPKLINRTKDNVTCAYCGGNCPNEPPDSDFLCDGFAGDIDQLYPEQ